MLLPDTPQAHELTHRPGHTLLVLGGPQADPARVNALVAELDAVAGTMDEAVAAQLGVVDVTILAVRPDRYVGLRDDRGDPRVVAEYLDGLVAEPYVTVILKRSAFRACVPASPRVWAKYTVVRPVPVALNTTTIEESPTSASSVCSTTSAS